MTRIKYWVVVRNMISLEDAILIAIARGVENIDELSDVLKVDREDILKIVEKLVREGLIKIEESGWWIFKKSKLVLTQRGFERASKAMEKLEEVAKFIKEKVKQGDRDYLNNLSLQWSYLLPLLLWMNLIDVFLWTSLIDMDMSENNVSDTLDIDDSDVDYDAEIF